MRRHRLLALVCAATLSLAACTGDDRPVDPSGRGTPTPSTAATSAGPPLPGVATQEAGAATSDQPDASPEPVLPAVLDGSGVAGLTTGVVSDQEAYVHVAWPVVPGVDALTAALEERAHERVDAYVSDNREAFGAEAIAHPELNSTGALTGHSPQAVGALERGFEFAGASTAQTWRTTWWDAGSGEVVDNVDLVDDAGRDAWARAVERELTERYGDALVAEELPAALAEGPAVVAFTADGEMVVGFDSHVMTPGAVGLVSVALPADETEALLSDVGRAALAATTDPSDPALATGTTEAPTSAGPDPSTGESGGAGVAGTGGDTDCSVEKCIAITYDDGPGAQTLQVAEAFSARGQHATFFVLGQQVAASPSTVASVAEAGHEIGLHTWDHASLPRLGAAGVRQELTSTEEALAEAGVEGVTLFRPPYGATDGTVLQVAGELGLSQVLWSIDTLDWQDRDTALVTRRVLDEARRGSIVLMHDIHPTTVAAAPAVVDGLVERGFTLVTVSDLLDDPQPGVSYSSGD